MITREKIVKCAEAIVNGMNLKEGEATVVNGGSHAQELLEEIGIQCYKQGAHPLITFTSDNYASRVYSEIPTETLEVTPKHILGAIKEADALITVENIKDPLIRTRFPREKIAARTKANVPIRKELYGEETGMGKKWTYAGWPTSEAAKFYNLDYEDLERLIIEGMMVPANTLRKRTTRLTKLLEGRDILHITDLKGTDFTCKVANRRVIEDDGVVDEHDIKMKNLGNNLPAGEVFIAPHENFGEGTINCPITIDRFSNKIIKDVTLQFQDGRLLLEKSRAKTNSDQIADTFKRCIEIDKKDEHNRTMNIAELGIGCNPAIDKAIGYILTDEKVEGSVHIAFGSNLGYGGTSKSCMHWDFVTDPSVTIVATDTDEIIMKDGKIL